MVTKNYRTYKTQLQNAKEEIAQLEIDLAKYGDHIESCPARHNKDRRCEWQCDFERVQKRLSA